MSTELTTTVNALEGSETIKIIHVAGELDESNLPEFERVIIPLMENEKIKIMIFNFTELHYINSKVVGYFAYLYSTLKKNGRRIIFASYNQAIHEILTLVGLDKLVDSEPTLNDAIQHAYTL